MKKILVLILVLFSVLLGYSFGRPFDSLRSLRVNQPDDHSSYKTAILRVGLVADSHNENDLLAKALRQAQGIGINFVIGLGDWTNLGTIEELKAARAKFDESKLEYFVTAGDRDGWESRNRGVANFAEVFGKASRVFQRNDVQFVILDNSDIYKGISPEDWEILQGLTLQAGQGETLSGLTGLTFVFAHKTPFHPESRHVMGEDSAEVASQAERFMDLIETTYPCHSVLDTESSDWIPHPFGFTQGKQVRDDKCPAVDGFFSGDLHFFAQFKSPQQSVKITTVGAVARQRNFQGPRFSVLTVYEDYSWEVEDVEIR